MARSLVAHTARHDLRLVLFGGEEQALSASTQHVAGLSVEERCRIRAVVNMEMIGFSKSMPFGVLLESSSVALDVVNALGDAARSVTSLKVLTSMNPHGSDHVPFLERGIPAVLTIASDTNPHIDSEDDKPELVNAELGLEILRMNTAFIVAALDGEVLA